MRRKNGEGSWGVKTINGYKYQYYRDENGKYTYAKTLKELKMKLSNKKDTPIKGNDTFVNYCNYWLKTVKALEIEQRTYDNYDDIINSRISKFDIADIQVSDLTTEHFRVFMYELAEKYSLGSIKKTWNIVKQVVELAEDEKKIQPGIIRKINLPKENNVAVKKKVVPFCSETDMHILTKEAYRRTGKNNRLVYGSAARLIVLIMYTGLRVSEACALTWNDVDMDNKTITVKNSVSKIKQRDKDRNVLKNEDGTAKYNYIKKDPKTDKSTRTIPLPQKAIDVLQFLIDENPDHKSTDFVAVTSEGKGYDKDQVRKTLARMQNNSNCSRKDYTPHSLRHGYGSVLISKGADIKLVSELLGHTDVTFTYNVYIGIFETDKKKAVDLFDISNEKD